MATSHRNLPQGRVILVTGAARGLGKCLARRLGTEGGHVVLADRDAPKAAATLDEFERAGIESTFLPVDLREDGASVEMVRRAFALHKRLDVLVNNARGRLPLGQSEVNSGAWDVLMGVTLRAAWEASEAALELMGPHSSIINIASVAAVQVTAEPCLYHMAKAAVVQMTRVHAVRGGARGIRVNAVLPGFIVQDEHRARFNAADNERYRSVATFAHPLGRVGSNIDVAEVVRFLCSPEAAFVTGQAVGVDGGLCLQDPSALLFLWERRDERQL